MAEGERSFPHPDTPPPIHPSEDRVEQRLSEQSVRALVDKYADVSKQYQERPWSELSKEKGVIEGRRSALDNILEKVGQSNVVQKVDRQVFNQVFNGEPAEPIDLAPTTQPDRGMEQSLLADYQHQYMLRLLSADSRPRIDIRDRITGRAKEINAYFDYASGLNEGKLEEMKGFLQTIGSGVQMDSLQQEADRLLQRDPQGMREEVEEQLARKTEATRDKLREAATSLHNPEESEESKKRLDASITKLRETTQDLQGRGDIQAIPSKELPEHPQQ